MWSTYRLPPERCAGRAQYVHRPKKDNQTDFFRPHKCSVQSAGMIRTYTANFFTAVVSWLEFFAFPLFGVHIREKCPRCSGGQNTRPGCIVDNKAYARFGSLRPSGNLPQLFLNGVLPTTSKFTIMLTTRTYAINGAGRCGRLSINLLCGQFT